MNETVLAAGLRAGVPFEVVCGGNAQCCTCHIHVPISEMESHDAGDYVEPEDKELDGLDMAENVEDDRSRLAC